MNGIHMFDGHGGGWMMIFWWMVVLIPLLVLVWWALFSRRPNRSKSEDDPRRVLERRYARGEIGKEEFEDKKKALRE